jgi:transposase-like protein
MFGEGNIFSKGAGMMERTTRLECPRCGSRNVININLSLEHGDRVAFYSCHRCDKRWWHKDGAPVDLPDVLEMARRDKSGPAEAGA